MATLYWTGAVNGGTGTWDTTDTTNWSTTSGGAGGASAPTVGDIVFFDANSGSGVCTLGSDVTCNILNMTDYVGTFDFSTYKVVIPHSGTTILLQPNAPTAILGSRRVELTYTGSTGTRAITGIPPEGSGFDVFVLGGSDTITGGIRCRNLDFTGFSGAWSGSFQFIYGDLIMSPSMTTTGTSPILFASTSATPREITTNGVTFNFELRFNGVGGTWELQDDLNVSTIRAVRLENGTLNLNNKNITAGAFFAWTGVKTLNMGSGTITLTGTDATTGFTSAWDMQVRKAGLTVNAGSSTINMTSASAKTFAGGDFTYHNLNQGGAGALTIQQSNTFANITNSVQPATITLTSGTTQTVGALNVSGTSGNLITLNASTPGSQATLSDGTGTNSVSFVSIQDINATGGATWNAFLAEGNVDAGNNTGWDFFASARKVFSVVFRSIFQPVFA